MSEQVGSTSNDLRTIGPREVVVRGNAQGFTQEIVVGPHQLTADEPKGVGGNHEGPTPYDLLLAALGSCTSITVTITRDIRTSRTRRYSARRTRAPPRLRFRMPHTMP
jgi:organic hydroperoxide reductase OsmC/OhrA